MSKAVPFCEDCGAPSEGQSRYCAEDRLLRRRATNRKHYASWFSRHGERRAEQHRRAAAKARIRRLEERAAELGYRLVPATLTSDRGRTG